MKKLLTVIFCLAILALTIGCQKIAPTESLPSSISTDILEVIDLGNDFDVSDLDALDAGLIEVLEGLEI